MYDEKTSKDPLPKGCVTNLPFRLYRNNYAHILLHFLLKNTEKQWKVTGQY